MPKKNLQPYLRFKPQDDYFPRESTKKIFKSNSEYDGLSSASEETKYSRSSMILALEIEELEKLDYLIEYDEINVQLKINDENEYYCSIGLVPPEIKNLSLVLVPMNLYKAERFIERSKCTFASIINYDDEDEILYIKNSAEIDIRQLYHLRFECNRFPVAACHHALDQIGVLGLERYFSEFQSVPSNCNKKKKKKNQNLKFINEDIAKNERQMIAVRTVLSEGYFPFPFVITGGPGTGKTTVMIECVAQILKLNPKSHVLITAQSNSVCDEIGIRLLKYVKANEVFRYYSRGQAQTIKDDYSKLLRKSSSLSSGVFKTPTYSQLYSYKVVIVTMITSNRFIAADFKKNHFDFIFIDECCAATEPECLVPIIGLGMENRKVNANIILLGDLNLLGPIVESNFACDLGLDVSFLERVMKHDISADRSITLDTNYRSHPAIAKFSNENFYNSSMKMKVPFVVNERTVGFSLLPNKKIPIIFYSVESDKEEDDEKKNHMNEAECDQIVFYVNYLLKWLNPKDIGIVSPYNRQVDLLKSKMGGLKGISIGTVEFFQGREKPVMIISTVKSSIRSNQERSNQSVFFDYRRLNVLLTRAKSLMIIVGNGKFLERIDVWKDFIKFCYRNNLNVKSFENHLDRSVGIVDEEESQYETDLDEFNYDHQTDDYNALDYFYDDDLYDNDFYDGDFYDHDYGYNLVSSKDNGKKKDTSTFTIKNVMLLSMVTALILRRNEKLDLKNILIFASTIYIYKDLHRPILSFRNFISLILLGHTWEKNDSSVLNYQNCFFLKTAYEVLKKLGNSLQFSSILPN